MTPRLAFVRTLFPVPKGMFAPSGNKRAFASIIVDTVGTGLFMALSLLFLYRVNGVHPVVAGPVMTAAGLASFLLMAPIGRLVQALGGRDSLLISTALGALGYALYLWATTPYVIAAAAFLVALGDRLTGTCWPVLAAERFGRAQMRPLFAVANSAKTLALGVGALVASLTLSAEGDGGLRIALLANVASFVVSFFILCTVPSKRGSRGGGVSRSSSVRMTDVVRHRPFMRLVVSQTAMSASWMIPAVAFPLYLTTSLHEPVALATVALAIRYIAITAVQVPLVHWVADWSRSRILRVSSASAALGVVAVAALPLVSGPVRVAGVVVATVLIAGSEIISKPTASAEAVLVAPEGGEAPYMAIFQVTWSLAYVLGPAVVGVGLQRPAVLWACLLGIILLGAFVGGACRTDEARGTGVGSGDVEPTGHPEDGAETAAGVLSGSSR